MTKLHTTPMKEIKFKKSELSILIHLLDHHVISGDYFGNKDRHYKMSKELLDKLEKLYNLYK